MSRRVWKYRIPFADGSPVNIPRDGKIVHCGPDPETGDPAIWVEVDLSIWVEVDLAPVEPRLFVVVATGGSIPDGVSHRGTAICGPYVWHIYEMRS